MCGTTWPAFSTLCLIPRSRASGVSKDGAWFQDGWKDGVLERRFDAAHFHVNALGLAVVFNRGMTVLAADA